MNIEHLRLLRDRIAHADSATCNMNFLRSPEHGCCIGGFADILTGANILDSPGGHVWKFALKWLELTDDEAANLFDDYPGRLNPSELQFNFNLQRWMLARLDDVLATGTIPALGHIRHHQHDAVTALYGG